MRVKDVVKYLSPSSLGCWEYNKVDWYKRYVLKERFPATLAMDCGTYFDHLCKTALGYQEVREVKKVGDGLVERVFAAYKEAGGLCDMLCTGAPILESTVTGEVLGVPLLGKPDIYGRTAEGLYIRDWKTSGFTANKPPSPPPGYYWDSKTQRGHNAYTCTDGYTNIGVGIEGPYGVQLTTYGMLLRTGDESVVLDAHWISPTRWAKYRYKMCPVYADLLAKRYLACWESDLDRVEMLM